MDEALSACENALESRPSFPQARAPSHASRRDRLRIGMTWMLFLRGWQAHVLRVLALEAKGAFEAAAAAAAEGLRQNPGHYSLTYQVCDFAAGGADVLHRAAACPS